MLPQIDASQHPVVVIVLEPEATLDEIDEFGEALLRLEREKGPFHAITDARQMSVLASTAMHRAKVSAVVNDASARGALLSEAIVVSPGPQQAIITAYSWLKKDKTHPFTVVTTIEAARAWTQERLEGRAVP